MSSISTDLFRTISSTCECLTQSFSNIPNGINALQHHEVMHNATLKSNTSLGHITIQSFIVAATVVAVSLLAFGALVATLLGIAAAIITFATRTAKHEERQDEDRTEFWPKEKDCATNLGALVHDLMDFCRRNTNKIHSSINETRLSEKERPWHPEYVPANPPVPAPTAEAPPSSKDSVSPAN